MPSFDNKTHSRGYGRSYGANLTVFFTTLPGLPGNSVNEWLTSQPVNVDGARDRT